MSKLPLSPTVTQRAARWQWALETDDGTYIAGVAIVPDIDRRGWVAGFPGEALNSAVQMRPLLRLYRNLLEAGVYNELRAWITSDDIQSIRFAECFGLRYDCGPATSFSPTGRDMSLFLWSKK